MKIGFFILLLALTGVLQVSSAAQRSIRVAFGSCNRFFQTHSLTTFTTILNDHPDHFVILGDFAYIDKLGYPMKWKPERDEKEIRRKIRLTLYSPEMKSLLESGTTLNVVWDDHDYNMNNGGANNPNKKSITQIFTEEFGIKQQLPDSISQHIKFADNVHLLLIDIRSHRTKNETLDESDWEWIQDKFKAAKDGDLFLMGSGVQFIYDDRPITEKWTPKDRIRMYKLLREYRVHAVMMSGDVHFAQIGRREGLNEITSSGLSFSAADHTTAAGVFVQDFFPHTYSNSSDRYVGINYGFIEIFYDASDNRTITELELSIKDQTGSTKLARRLSYDSLEIRSFNQSDLLISHEHLVVPHVWRSIKDKPDRVLCLLPLTWPYFVLLLTIYELFSWKIK